MVSKGHVRIMNKPIYPTIEFALTPESWEDIFLDEDGNEIISAIPHYIPPKLHWRTFYEERQHYGWVDLDIIQIINDDRDKIVNDNKYQVMMKLKHRFGF